MIRRAAAAKAMKLEDMKRIALYKTAEQPGVVYHMTSRESVRQILQDKKVRTMTDFVCFFCPTLEDLLEYIELSEADTGRHYWDFDGLPHKAPPLDRNNTVVLKLKPRYKEPDLWFREENDCTRLNEEQRLKRQRLDHCRVLHYGDFKFRTFPEDIEVIELTDVYK